MVEQKAQQLDFFDLTDEWRGNTVVQLSNGDWQAKINYGWWTAIRSTKKAAIDAVIKMYRMEVEYYDQH